MLVKKFNSISLEYFLKDFRKMRQYRYSSLSIGATTLLLSFIILIGMSYVSLHLLLSKRSISLITSSDHIGLMNIETWF